MNFTLRGARQFWGGSSRLCVAYCLLATASASLADSLPIRIDSPRRANVYVKSVNKNPDFVFLSDSTPAVYAAQPGERVDIRVVAQDGLLYRWVGNRQNLSGPANVTIRLERSLAWERLSALSVTSLLLGLGIFWSWRKRTRKQFDVAKSQIMSLQERAVSAEKVGSLARTLGEYRVLDKLGAGAMGTVYKVEDSDGAVFAAKVPNEMDERVLREAEVSASLASPHIVKCFGLVEGEQSFLLLEYMRGQTVHQWLENNPTVSLHKIHQLVSQLLDGLEVAHGQGVLHRDLKPENLFLAESSDEEVLKIMDFGLASSLNSVRLTRSGEAMGTPIYASPEQLSGNPVDSTADLYSVGVFIFELATGLLPWSQTDPVALTLQKYKPLSREPIELRSDLPMAWNQIVVDLLAGDPAKRPPSIVELKQRWHDGARHITGH